jgi:hypothetical protein
LGDARRIRTAGTASFDRALLSRVFLPEGEMQQISRDTESQLSAVLGRTVVRLWSKLPQDVQHRLFEEAVMSHGESMRPQLAIFLHGKHPRTSDSTRQLLEPDSLGG